MSRPTRLPTTDDAIHRRIMVHKDSENKLALALISVNDMLAQAGVHASVSYEFVERETTTELSPEGSWLTIQLNRQPATNAAPAAEASEFGLQPGPLATMVMQIKAVMDEYYLGVLRNRQSDSATSDTP